MVNFWLGSSGALVRVERQKDNIVRGQLDRLLRGERSAARHQPRGEGPSAAVDQLRQHRGRVGRGLVGVPRVELSRVHTAARATRQGGLEDSVPLRRCPAQDQNFPGRWAPIPCRYCLGRRFVVGLQTRGQWELPQAVPSLEPLVLDRCQPG